MAEKRILGQLRRGGREEFENAVRFYTPYIVTVVQNQLGPGASETEVEEICIDVFLALWQGRNSIRTDNLRGWLVRVARNKAIDHLRKKGVDPLPMEDRFAVSEDMVSTNLEKNERKQMVRKALDSLGESDREIFLRHYYYNQTVAEIAEEMKMNPETVKSRLARGREKLKKKLEQEGYNHAD